MTSRILLALLVSGAAALAQDYKLEPLSAPPPGLPAAYAAQIGGGYRISGPKGPWCEIWFRKSIPLGAKPADPTITLPIAQGTLIGVIRFPGAAEDRRGQVLKAGLYTLRYSNFPVDGAHQGVAPQRDFALATPVANDADPAAMPAFEALVTQSKTSGTAHAAVFSLEAPPSGTFPALTQQGDNDWVLSAKSGDVALGMIVVGKVE